MVELYSYLRIFHKVYEQNAELLSVSSTEIAMQLMMSWIIRYAIEGKEVEADMPLMDAREIRDESMTEI